jgi:4'-phosphopantetheinyl transferase
VKLLCLLALQPELRAGMADPDGWLSASERERLLGFGTAARRDLFLAGRWLARNAVRRWQGVDRWPVLEVADSGACRVAGGGVHVSISHTGEHVACAVAAWPVGVDMESLARPRDHLALARTVHSPAQRERLERLEPHERARAVLQAWTLKEAWLKARERGLDFALMRSLEFDDDLQGDAAVADAGDLVLALAADPRLPLSIEGPAGLSWRRCRSRHLAEA